MSRSVGVVIVSYNTRDHLRACLRTVVADAEGTVIVADNGSSDGSIEMVRDEFPSVRLIVDASNPGYGAAANHGVEACDEPFALILNSDTLLPRGTIAALERYARAHPEAGIVGPRLRNVDGSLQQSCRAFPSPGFVVMEFTSARMAAARVPPLRRRYFIDWPHDEARAVPWVSGAVLLVRRDAFEAIGGFDPAYYMYYEEVDLARRMADSGWETHFAPVADVTHVGGASTVHVWEAMRVREFHSLVEYVARHGGRLRAVTVATMLSTMLTGKLVLDSARRALSRDTRARSDLEARVAHWRVLSAFPFIRTALHHRPDGG